MATVLSAYELKREETIARNRQFLVSLGIDKPVLPTIAKRPRTVATLKGDPDFRPPERRSTRVARGAQAQGGNTGGRDDESDDESDDDDEAERAVKQGNKRQKVKVASAATSDSSQACITVEAAKTGRSKCRRCLEALPASEARVGMESWMVRRSRHEIHHELGLGES